MTHFRSVSDALSFAYAFPESGGRSNFPRNANQGGGSLTPLECVAQAGMIQSMIKRLPPPQALWISLYHGQQKGYYTQGELKRLAEAMAREIKHRLPDGLQSISLLSDVLLYATGSRHRGITERKIMRHHKIGFYRVQALLAKVCELAHAIGTQAHFEIEREMISKGMIE